MANFERAVGPAGAGYDDATYSLTIPLHNRRSVALYGGGPGASRLSVGSTNTGVARVIYESDSARTGAALAPGRREFWVDGVGVGTSTLYARVPGGGDYSNQLTVRVIASGDLEPIARAFASSRDALRTAAFALRNVRNAVAISALNPPSTRIFNKDPFHDLQKRV